MAKQLARHVHGLRDPETGRPRSFGPGDTPPGWAAEQITNPAAWGDDPVDQPDDAAPESDTPNKSATKPEWVAYAVEQGMDLAEAENMTKDDLIEHFTEG